MKTKTILLAVLIMFGACQITYAQKRKKKQKNVEQQISTTMTKNDSVSYAFGIVLGHNLKAEKVFDLDLEILKKGINDVLTKDEYDISGEDARAIVNDHIQATRKVREKKAMEEGLAFLEKNKNEEDVIVTESGLQYKILVEGDGPIPKATNKVKTHYHGTLIDGTVFDSSVLRNEPSSFPVNGVIKGWVEALQMMPVGSKWRLFIPPSLAYGEHGAGKKIGPNATLVFEIELIEIEN